MSGESPARDGGLLGRRRGLTAAPRAGRSRRRRAVSATAGAAALLAGLGGLAACGAPAPGVPAQPSATSGQRLQVRPIPGQLLGVSAGPGGSAWVAGDTCASGCGTSSEADRTLILRWDGLSWSQTASPSPGLTAFLYGVSAAPDGSAWAIGSTGTSSGAGRTLILHWDGAAWSRAASPSP